MQSPAAELKSQRGFESRAVSSDLLEIFESIHAMFLRQKELRSWEFRVVGDPLRPLVDVTSVAPDGSAAGPHRIVISLGFRRQVAEILNRHYQAWIAICIAGLEL